MVLVDTSIWVDYFRTGDDRLRALLTDGQVLAHPFIIGELALGNLTDRSILASLDNLPRAVTATDVEVRAFIESVRLHGSGVGWVDAHLLASVRLTLGATLWTGDSPLAAASSTLGLGAGA